MTRGKDSNGDTFSRPRKQVSTGNVADWGSVDAETIRKCVETASKKGGALRLGYTRDGGAYAIGVYAGSNYFTDYVRPSEDVEGYLHDLTISFDDWDGSTETGPEKSGSKRR